MSVVRVLGQLNQVPVMVYYLLKMNAIIMIKGYIWLGRVGAARNQEVAEIGMYTSYA